ncbi:beta-galactosidase trimerization domain-containing protein [Sporolactobacillus sp. CPB3-1]|uniref:Beta-galactosidase trimerization domain-containing protein n=1 Tax=Sporolactobacillus mangiferae TaxID=2940498 RepID=A0ABT0MCF0_9BACL|nr:beta-galactosidase trimerization domain-containing protein [Sporolactobacillus mangiferae]
MAIIFDWENYWAFEYSSGPNVELSYVDQVHRYYAAWFRKNVAVDMIPDHLSARELEKYDVVFAPVLMMVKPGVAEAIEQFVQNGGTFVTTFLSGISDEHDNVVMGGYPGPFRRMCGIWAEEIDALPPKKSLRIQFGSQQVSGSLVANCSHLEGAQSLATYDDDVFYKGSPVVSVNTFGEGAAYYVGTVLDEKGMDALVDRIIAAHQLPFYPSPDGVEITVRTYGDDQLYFVLNHTAEKQKVNTARFAGRQNILNAAIIDEETILEPHDVLIIRS